MTCKPIKRWFQDLGSWIPIFRPQSNVEVEKTITELQILNNRLRETMNQIQEKDQRLSDASHEMQALNRVLAEKERVVAIERNRLNSIIQEAGEGILIINEKNEIETINRKVNEILGYRADQKIPEGYQKFFILQLWKEMHGAKSDIVKKEVTIQRPREAVVMITLSRLSKEHDGRGGFVALLRDITFEKRIERMKSDFVANVSHEIRAPMAPMKDALGLVLDGVAGEITAKQRQFLMILGNNMDRLSRLINDLLDLSKIEAGRMDLVKEHLDIGSLIKEVVGSLMTYAEKKQISLSVNISDDLPKINCDRDRITQVLVNLMMNALKFTPDGGSICIAYCATGRNTHDAILQGRYYEER